MRSAQTVDGGSGPRIAIVVPVCNDAASIEPLLGEIEAALQASGPFEVIYVDDGSSDGTRAELARVAAGRPWLRSVRHALRRGKSAALWTGVQAARAPIVATLDGDGRNDPAALPRMVAELIEAGADCGLVAGQRLGRRDSELRRFRSKVANSVRSAILNDGTRDAACGLKCFPRAVFLNLSYFDGMHRFLPALIRGDGYAISLLDVVDRPSRGARAEPELFTDAFRALRDLIGVAWLIRRRGRMPPLLENAAVPDEAQFEPRSDVGNIG